MRQHIRCSVLQLAAATSKCVTTETRHKRQQTGPAAKSNCIQLRKSQQQQHPTPGSNHVKVCMYFSTILKESKKERDRDHAMLKIVLHKWAVLTQIQELRLVLTTCN